MFQFFGLIWDICSTRPFGCNKSSIPVFRFFSFAKQPICNRELDWYRYLARIFSMVSHTSIGLAVTYQRKIGIIFTFDFASFRKLSFFKGSVHVFPFLIEVLFLNNFSCFFFIPPRVHVHVMCFPCNIHGIDTHAKLQTRRAFFLHGNKIQCTAKTQRYRK